MNGKMLIDSLIRHKKGPRMGLYEVLWWDTLEDWVKQGYPMDPITGTPENPVIHFNYDKESTGGWFDVMPIEGHSELICETNEWEIRQNGAGASFKYWKNKSGTPEHVDFKMVTREIWEREYRHRLIARSSRLSIDNDKKSLQAARERGVWAFFGHLGLWEILRSSLGDICMFESLLLDPDWVLDFNRVYTDFYKEMYKLQFEYVGLPDGIWFYDDLAYKNGIYCSQDILYKLFAPFYEEIVDFFHDYDLPVVFHCCGAMEGALQLIVDCGFDALNPMERKAGCDPLKFARKYRDKLAFIGGLDAITLESGNMDKILREADELIEGMRDAGAAFIFGSDHSVSSNVKYSDYKKLVDYFKERAEY